MKLRLLFPYFELPVAGVEACVDGLRIGVVAGPVNSSSVAVLCGPLDVVVRGCLWLARIVVVHLLFAVLSVIAFLG